MTTLSTTGTPIETLKFSNRTYNALMRAGIDTVEKLQTLEQPHLLRGIGKDCAKEIALALADLPPLAEAEQESSDPSFEYPYKDLTKDSPQYTYKLLVNTLAQGLATNTIPPEKRAIAQKLLQENKEMADAPEGYYPFSSVYSANPIHKLTHEEKLRCIRTLPIDIVNKLFPHL